MPPIDSTDKLPPISETSGPQESMAAHALTGPLPDKVGPYKILGLLGTGGMGVVYRAEQDKPRRHVALKVMRPWAVGPEQLYRFKREAEALGRLQHDGIARIYEAGEIGAGAGSQPYLAMELIDGEPLTVYADRHKLSIPQRLRLMIQICQAVQHAHYEGVVHRDLKPANVLVDKDGRPKVLDFGVAHVTENDTLPQARQTAVGQLVGTLPYMSPEQAEGNPAQVDRLSDVYALGVTCYELLTGQLPYDLKGKTALAAVRMICETEPMPISSVNKVIDRDLDAVVTKALEKDKARRYQTADALAADLERYLNYEPVTARPGGAVYKARKFAKRHPAWVTLGSVLVLALAFGIPLIAWAVIQGDRANLAEKEKSQLQVVADLKAKENARLEADGFVQKARLAGQKGQWRDALANYDKALEFGHPDSIGLRLNKIRASQAINDYDTCLREIEVLAAAPNLGENEGSVLLLQGDILLGRDDGKAEHHIRRARDKRLSTAEDAYAAALLAKSTPEAVDLLRKTLVRDPYQPRARAALELLLITLGRLDEARLELKVHQTFFPDDINTKVLRALLLALQRDPDFLPADPERPEGDLAGANAVLDELRGQLADEDINALRAVAKLFFEFQNPANKPDPQTGIPKLVPHLAAFAPLLPRLWGVPAGAARNDDVAHAHVRLAETFPLPPTLRKGLVRVGRALAAADGFAKVGIFPQWTIDELARAVAIHPEGTILYGRALVLLAAQRWDETEQAALEAANASALLPVRRPALSVAVAAQSMRYFLAKTKPDPAIQLLAVEALIQVQQPAFCPAAVVHGVQYASNEALLRQAVKNLRTTLALGPIRDRDQRVIAVNVASIAQEYGLTRQLLDDWERDAPDDLTVLKLRARTELKAGAYVAALEAANKYLQKKPDDADVLRFKEQAGEKLTEQYRRLLPAGPDKREP